LHGEGKYFDVLEKTLYNGALSGVNLAGDRFFYPNPLESDGRHQRSPWFGCACCPSNVARFIPAIPGYIYSVTDNDLFVNLYASNEADIMVGKHEVMVSQETLYPWEGKVSISLNPAKATEFTLRLRIPGWARNEALPGALYSFSDTDQEAYILRLNGEDYKAEVTDGYAEVKKKWVKGDIVELYLPMPVRTVVADARVKADSGRYAVQRGPLMFCAEWPDNPEGEVMDLVIDKKPAFTTEYIPGLLNGTVVIRTEGYTGSNIDDNDLNGGSKEITLIPYHLWNNRGRGEMRVWLPYEETGNL
jgi:DUF1680 family protein